MQNLQVFLNEQLQIVMLSDFLIQMRYLWWVLKKKTPQR